MSRRPGSDPADQDQSTEDGQHERQAEESDQVHRGDRLGHLLLRHTDEDRAGAGSRPQDGLVGSAAGPHEGPATAAAVIALAIPAAAATEAAAAATTDAATPAAAAEAAVTAIPRAAGSLVPACP